MASTGQNVWFDLMTTDVESAKRFYTEVIGWKTQQWTNGDPAMPYTMWVAGEASVVNGPMDIPDNDRIAQCQDPQGGFFAIYSHGKK